MYTHNIIYIYIVRINASEGDLSGDGNGGEMSLYIVAGCTTTLRDGFEYVIYRNSR